jgi:hypothetical protein
MAAKEPYDYLTTISPDVDQTLTLNPQAVMIEEPVKNDIVHRGDDGRSAEGIGLGGSNMIFIFRFNYALLTESDAGTILDFFCDSAKGDGMVNTFKFTAPDTHTYVVRFGAGPARQIRPTNWGIPNVSLYVEGRVAD